MANHKIIFVNRYFYPDHSATSQMLSDLAFDLACEGYPVNVVTSRQLYDRPTAELTKAEDIRGVRIFRIWTTRFGRAGLLGRALDYASFYLSAFLVLLRLTAKGDVIVAKTDPPLISVICGLVAVLRGAALVNWIQDLFPEVATELDMKAIGPAMPLARSLRNWSLRRAACNVVLGELMAQKLSEQRVDAESVRVIPNWADGDHIKPLAPENNELRREWRLKDKFVVGYSGNLGRAHEFFTILRAAEILRDRDERVMFLFIGSGAQRVALEQWIEAHALTNVLFRPYQPKEKLGLSLSVPDAHLVCLKPGLEGLIVPSKFYGIAAAGRPTLFVGDPDGEIPRVLNAVNCGYAVSAGDPEGLVRYIEALKSDPDACRQMGLRARTEFERRFSRPRAVAAWKDLLDSFGSEKAAESSDSSYSRTF
ncbi:glycosyltransferase family 4 protein [Methylocaldum sp. GT1TLB]|uniref:glycosyltransferase family 4 protein n=1 Tax=Methylocaldum sp. GT1TLB TaxID=3438965 RepID=UPI003DA12837